MKDLLPLWLATLLLAACGPAAEQAPAPLFTLLAPEATGVTFRNEIVEDEGFNVLEYEYFFNGGGVAVGDVNGDGLPDFYFTANSGPNRLYLNKGNLTFEDVTGQAGVQGGVGWATGVTMADVNGDGLLDLYVCKSGRVSEPHRRNELYINNGNLTFSERAAAYGLDDPSYSTHAAFFDYDRDGDLDMYLLNHPIRRYARFDVALLKRQRDPLAGDKLYRNDTGSGSGTGSGAFVDVSEEAGILGNPLGFGLGVVVSDLNKDGWPDLYVANDYIEDDYLYINQQDGTFREESRARLAHTSYSSMGTDVADFNNDALPDIVTLDMLAEDNLRQKVLKGPENEAFYRQMRERGYHEQYMRNVLQLNNGNGTFSEIGQLAGVSNTDWSWAALFADFDRDGYKDLLVTNGYMRDYTNLDFLQFTLARAIEDARARGEQLDPVALVRQMPTSQLKNYVFRNRGDLHFENRTQAWGLDQAALSNGAAYADLDNDGDLDLVINNINQPAFIYRNDADKVAPAHHYLKVRLQGRGGNRFGVGARVLLRSGEHVFYQEAAPVRGYQSTVDPVLFFGLGGLAQVDLDVTWPDGTRQYLNGVTAGQTVTLKQEDASAETPPLDEAPAPYFTGVPEAQGPAFVHREDAFDDFEQQPLLPHRLSRLGPALAHADVNRDGLEDVFVGGARGQAAALYLQQLDGAFQPVPVAAFEAHRDYEDVAARFLDVDGDGDLDLYVVSGGNDAGADPALYQDRVYLNGGFGAFTHGTEVLPKIESSGGAVAAADFDGDGDLDLFVGGRVAPGRYPYAPRSYLLENTGGRYVDVTARAAEALLHPGMVAAARWLDLDGDGADELVLAGEWMPIRVFRHDGDGTFTETTGHAGLARTNGWWNSLAAADFDGDGDLDLVAGNRGRNAQMQASVEEPAALDAADFDGNGTVEAVMSYYIQGRSYPVPARDELLAQIPSLAERFPTYAAYAGATMADVFTRRQLRDALHLEAYAFSTSLFENQGDGTFRGRPLPVPVQFSPVNDVLVTDVDRDGVPDLLLAGNNFGVRAQWGRDDAGQGWLLLGRGDLTFDVLGPARSGFFAPGDVRRLALVRTPGGPLVLVANNDAALSAFVVLPVAMAHAGAPRKSLSGRRRRRHR